MSAIDDMVQWLTAQLDEDERVARGAVGGWITKGPHPDDRTPVGSHMALHDPARVLREVEATRKIVELHASDGAHECPAGHDSPGDVYLDYERTCLTLRLLALPYSDRPGYRQEWAP